jgi:hypothetical protein
MIKPTTAHHPALDGYKQRSKPDKGGDLQQQTKNRGRQYAGRVTKIETGEQVCKPKFSSAAGVTCENLTDVSVRKLSRCGCENSAAHRSKIQQVCMQKFSR